MPSGSAQVCIFMDDSLLRGNRTVKVNSGGLDAFSSPNYPPLAMLETGIRFRPSAVLDLPKGRFMVHGELETNIAVWRSEWAPCPRTDCCAAPSRHHWRCRRAPEPAHATCPRSHRTPPPPTPPCAPARLQVPFA